VFVISSIVHADGLTVHLAHFIADQMFAPTESRLLITVFAASSRVLMFHFILPVRICEYKLLTLSVISHTDFSICFGVLPAYEGVNALPVRIFGSDSLKGVVIFVIIHSFGTGIFTVLPETVHLVKLDHTASAIFSSCVFGITDFPIFHPILNAHHINVFQAAHIATCFGSIFHSLAIQYLAHCIAHSDANFAVVHKNQGLNAHNLFGHIKDAHISVIVSHTFALVEFGSNGKLFCANSLPFFHIHLIVFVISSVCFEDSCLACENVLSVKTDFQRSQITPPI